MENEFTGMIDKNYDDIYFGQEINLFGMKGEIVFECGAFGIGFEGDGIDYDLLQKEMDNMSSCCGNRWIGCLNDNFLSLWELHWNFNSEEYCIEVLEIVG